MNYAISKTYFTQSKNFTLLSAVSRCKKSRKIMTVCCFSQSFVPSLVGGLVSAKIFNKGQKKTNFLILKKSSSWQKELVHRFISNVPVQKMKFCIKEFLSKCDQIRRSLQIWSHLPKKFLTESLIFCAECHVYILREHSKFLINLKKGKSRH